MKDNNQGKTKPRDTDIGIHSMEIPPKKTPANGGTSSPPTGSTNDSTSGKKK